MPEQILTDNGKVFTGRFDQPPVEVLFDRICRENGIEHLLTQPRSPTTTGKIERFHRTLRAEFDTDRVFTQPADRPAGELDEWVERLQHQPPAPVAGHGHPGQPVPSAPTDAGDPSCGRRGTAPRPATAATDWVARRVAANGVVCVTWQQVSVGRSRAGATLDVLVTDQVLQFWVGDQLLQDRDPHQHRARSEEEASTSSPRRRPNMHNECQGSTEVDPSPINRRSYRAHHPVCDSADA